MRVKNCTAGVIGGRGIGSPDPTQLPMSHRVYDENLLCRHALAQCACMFLEQLGGWSPGNRSPTLPRISNISTAVYTLSRERNLKRTP